MVTIIPLPANALQFLPQRGGTYFPTLNLGWHWVALASRIWQKSYCNFSEPGLEKPYTLLLSPSEHYFATWVSLSSLEGKGSHDPESEQPSCPSHSPRCVKDPTKIKTSKAVYPIHRRPRMHEGARHSLVQIGNQWNHEPVCGHCKPLRSLLFIIEQQRTVKDLKRIFKKVTGRWQMCSLTLLESLFGNIHIYQIIKCTLNLHTVVCQLYLNKARGENTKNKSL